MLSVLHLSAQRLSKETCIFKDAGSCSKWSMYFMTVDVEKYLHGITYLM